MKIMNRLINKKIILSFLIFTSLFNISFAQVSDGIVIDPEYPGAFQDVSLTVRSYNFDIDTANITWYIDNKVVLSGGGEKSLSTKTGDIGSQKIVRAVAMKGNQKVFDQTISLNPQSVDLLWESKESYTPPFYEGKALPGESSLISVVAMPNFVYGGKRVDPSTISYAWYLNTEFIPNSGGYGKQKLTMNLDYLSEKNVIKVVARDQNGNISQKETTIYPTQIDPVFYLKDPLFGVDLNKAIRNKFEVKKEFTLIFSPYYLSTKNIPSNQINYTWSLGGMPLSDKITNNTVSMRPAADTYGSKILSVSLDNTARILQDMKTSLEIIFDTRN